MFFPTIKSNVVSTLILIGFGVGSGRKAIMDSELPNPKSIDKISPKITAYRRRGSSQFHYTFEESQIATNSEIFIEKLHFHEFLQEIGHHRVEMIIFLIHGFDECNNFKVTKWIGQMKDELLRSEKGRNILLFTVDWSKGCKRKFTQANFGWKQAMANTSSVSNWLAPLIVQLRSELPLCEIRGVGNGIGGCLLGQCGRSSGGSLDRISALGPCHFDEFAFDLQKLSLSKFDAPIVDVYHSKLHTPSISPGGKKNKSKSGSTTGITRSRSMGFHKYKKKDGQINIHLNLNTSRSAANLAIKDGEPPVNGLNNGNFNSSVRSTSSSATSSNFENPAALDNIISQPQVNVNSIGTVDFYPVLEIPAASDEATVPVQPIENRPKRSISHGNINSSWKSKSKNKIPELPKPTDTYIKSISHKRAFLTMPFQNQNQNQSLKDSIQVSSNSNSNTFSSDIKIGFQYNGAHEGLFYYKPNPKSNTIIITTTP